MNEKAIEAQRVAFMHKACSAGPRCECAKGSDLWFSPSCTVIKAHAKMHAELSATLPPLRAREEIATGTMSGKLRHAADSIDDAGEQFCSYTVRETMRAAADVIDDLHRGIAESEQRAESPEAKLAALPRALKIHTDAAEAILSRAREEIARAAQVCRDKYCELLPGKRRWSELSDQERDVDILCLEAALSALSSAAGQEWRERLGEALLPFGLLARRYDHHKAPDDEIVRSHGAFGKSGDRGYTHITVGDLRRAAALLNELAALPAPPVAEPIVAEKQT